MELGVSPETERLWARVLRPVAERIAANAPGLSVEVVGRIRPQLPELFPDEEAFEANRASTEASVRAFAQTIEDGGDLRHAELPPETLAYARDGARRGVPFGSLMRSYRLAQAVVWDMLSAELATACEDRDELHRAVQICSSLLFAFADAALVSADEAYAEERERWHRSAAAARAQTIETILAGRLADERTAAQRLRYDLDRHHVAVIASTDAAIAADDAHEALEAAISQIATALDAQGTLAHPTGVHTLTAWLSSSSGFDGAQLGRLRIDPRSAPHVTAAVGDAARGIEGFRASHEQAACARRAGKLMSRGPGSVTSYGDVALQALATADLDQARAFVRRTLGALAAPDDTSLRLAATLAVYLDEHASRSRAAKRLAVHENTISYRIRQTEEILGRSVESDTLDLRVALSLAPIVR